jgi:CTP:molybdopterin cytidylyltransferase MocA
MNDVAAIVLAAGRSRRMGKFKPLLPFGNQTVIEACCGNLRVSGVEEVIVVIGHRAQDIRHVLDSVPVNFVINPNPDAEMSSSIELGVAAISPAAKVVLITPVDHPGVSSAVLRSLTAHWQAGHKLIQPEFNGKGGHPVLIDLAYRRELLDLGKEGLRGFFASRRGEVLRLRVESPFVAQDMDTWDDYLRLHEAVFGYKPAESVSPDEPNDRPTSDAEPSSK